MKRYILLNAVGVLFFSVINFGMLDEAKSRSIVAKKPLTITNKYCSLEEMMQQYIKKQRIIHPKLNFKFKPGKPLKKTKRERACYGLIAQDVQSPKEKALQQTITKLSGNLGRTPTVQEVITERKRESFVSVLSNDEQFVKALEKTNEILMKHCVEQDKKILQMLNQKDID
jgi:hypothetical protein